MNNFQESCCSILGVLLFFLLQVSCADPDVDVVHKAVGDSLELIADYSKKDLEVQWKYNEDSGSFSIVAVGQSGQHPTKIIELHVHGRITDVQIVYSDSWLQLKNICMFHLLCLASGDPNPSYSWTRHQVKAQSQHLKISLRPAESTTLTCTASNSISFKYITKTVVCTGKPSMPSDLIIYVKIESSVSWLQDICMFHLWCLASGHPNPSYSWIGHQTQGPHLNITLRPAESATFNCTANNTVSMKYATKTVVCTEKSEGQTLCVKS
ncbi:basement membrane-specific heparan sulfate proteoglycan core protein-like isoform X2 [Labeo rohita]|uniref:basement membrane-specific heparan sulfate proteoglycan core protein-like isoform X2 n=1 Tax=Labeo rohita TaxID=84645 RepID=UPI0021E2FAF6|nr:basement membrane-specific heparan sulfate proteoglycan core protein-like isoform X2 [Labeo rohita]